MSTIVNPSIFKFLNDLKKNNTREWFADNKDYYLKEEEKIKEFFTTINDELSKIDNIGGMKAYRIYRDIRFSKDKTPYKTYRSCSYKRATEALRGGYHLEITPGGSFLAAGFWQPNKEDLFRIRKEFEMDSTIIRRILNTSDLKNKFNGFHAWKTLKVAPSGFDKNHPNIGLIRKKDFIVLRKFTDKEVLSKDFHSTIIDSFKAVRPFFNYMSDVLTTNLNGESILEE
ncbi:MAG: DUF2461 domain-containing protein [Flavobacteriales bacterium]|jgi:uncharacterized protein (TIGR02453 family)|nr:DUF2461 domain-containing protein [Flavobacteriales bacterium]MBT4881087.1 DUF2461 domain-containing protein [Flavobacteriales bacterium]